MSRWKDRRDALSYLRFAGLSRLKGLEIQGNKVTDAVIAKLKAAIPGLEVVK